jgi:hypothetical protein
MSTVKANNHQVGQSVTATNNFTLYQPASPDGTVRLGVGNAGATTADVLVANSSSQVMVGTATPSTGAALTVNGAIKGTIASGTSVASTSGTSIDFTGIPSWAKRVTVMFNGVSTTGTQTITIRLGAGSIQSSGYAGSASAISASAAGSLALSSGFDVVPSSGAPDVFQGSAVLTLITGNTWVCNAIFGQSDITRSVFIGGSVALSGTLDRVRITSTGGTDTFDAGSINILYEG